MQSTIREHRDGGNAGGIFNRYNVIRVSFKGFICLAQKFLTETSNQLIPLEGSRDDTVSSAS